MGNARARGTYEERKANPLTDPKVYREREAGRIGKANQAPMPNLYAMLATMGLRRKKAK